MTAKHENLLILYKTNTVLMHVMLVKCLLEVLTTSRNHLMKKYLVIKGSTLKHDDGGVLGQVSD
jgi:hypothetical protein